MASIKLKFRTSSVQEKEGRLYYQVIIIVWHVRSIQSTESIPQSGMRTIQTSFCQLPSLHNVKPIFFLERYIGCRQEETAVGHCTVGQGRHIYSRTPSLTTSMREKRITWHYRLYAGVERKLRRIGKKRMVARYKPNFNSPALPERRRCAIGGSRWDNDTRL